MLGQLSGEEQTDGRLDFPAGDGAALVVVGQARGFGGNALEDVVDKAVHDRHGLAADTGVGVHLFQHLVNVDAVGFLPPLLLLFLISLSDVFLGFARLFGGLSASLGRHFLTTLPTQRLMTALRRGSFYTGEGRALSADSARWGQQQRSA